MQELAITRETAERFAIPDANPKTRAYAISAAKPASELPPVSRPSGAEEPGRFIDAATGETRSYGGTYDGRPKTMLQDPNADAGAIARAQAPDVVNPSITVEQPPTNRQPERPPGVTGGGGGRFFDERMGNYRERGGDIYQERTARRQEEAKKKASNSRNRFNRRNLGIGAAATGGAALAGAGISSLINNEREAREEQR